MKPDLLLRYAGLMLALFLIAGCNPMPDAGILNTGKSPSLEPDYAGVTVPVNIAPLNFRIRGEGKWYRVKVTSSAGYGFSLMSAGRDIRFPERHWKRMMNQSAGGSVTLEIFSKDVSNKWRAFKPVKIFVAPEPADPWLCYRLLYPGYETWSEIQIIQRNIETFRESILADNRVMKNNCINCHSFNGNDPEKFLLHVRGSMGGTYFGNKDGITRTDLKTPEMNASAVYPAWHPGGRYVAFSSNNVIQSFHAVSSKNIEVLDLASSLYLYDTEMNQMVPVKGRDTLTYMETFPEWSPDGNFLYFCRADEFVKGSDFTTIKYNLVRKSFDSRTGSFGDDETVFNAAAAGKSVSFPRISPDGRFLVYVLHKYGTFSIWHKEADLYLLDLHSGKISRLRCNSNESESYHSWSSNSRWLVFSSKRGDGLTARPWFAYIDESGHARKPFVLPQKDPGLYGRMLKTFNKPEFVTGKIGFTPRDFARAAKKEPLKAGSPAN